jgi:hypothetical protein
MVVAMVAGATVVVDVASDEGVVPLDEQPAKRPVATASNAPHPIVRLTHDAVGRVTSIESLYRSLLQRQRAPILASDQGGPPPFYRIDGEPLFSMWLLVND